MVWCKWKVCDFRAEVVDDFWIVNNDGWNKMEVVVVNGVGGVGGKCEGENVIEKLYTVVRDGEVFQV